MLDRVLDAGRMAELGQQLGEHAVALELAFEQHAVEIEDDRVEAGHQSSNRAVPTRTAVAPSITAALKSADIPMLEPGDVMASAQAWRAARNKAPARRPSGGIAISPASGSGERAHRVDQLADLADRAAALLLLLADIDLDIDGRDGARPFPASLTSASSSERAVERMDRVEQPHRLGGLVRLQPADAVEADVGMASEQRRPFGERFLDPAFAEIALAGVDQRLDLVGRAALADRDQLDVRRDRAGQALAAAAIASRICSAAIGGSRHRARYRKALHRAAADQRLIDGASELESGADVDGLAVAAVVLERRQAVALDIVADAAGQRDARDSE